MSLRALLLDALLKQAFARNRGTDVASEVSRRNREGSPRPAPVPKKVARRFRVTTALIQGQPVTTLHHHGRRRRVLVYLPGGGYAQPISRSHWIAIARLISASGTDAVVPLYHVAPEGNAEKAHRLVSDVLARVRREWEHGEIVLAGDSAGAGLALSCLQRDPDGIRAAVLLNPWLDVEISNPAAAAWQDWDVILRSAELREWGRTWAGDLDTTDPAVSPLHGRFDELPPVHIVTGGRDLLLPDALEAHQLLARAGNLGSLVYAPDANHAVGLTGVATPEGRRAFRAIVDAVRS